MTAARERDDRAAALLEQLFSEAEAGAPTLPASIEADLDHLFAVKAFGFREIMITVVLARLLDPTYTPSTNLYACNPRPLYEGPIRAALGRRGIPRNLSGPLNQAKATQGLDQTWAAQRRPRTGAQATLRLVAYLEGGSASTARSRTRSTA